MYHNFRPQSTDCKTAGAKDCVGRQRELTVFSEGQVTNLSKLRAYEI